ncbi:PREDICTED: uncharacterized protein LOC104730478 [Camelina sativa]|uniref:Uncharacterized protein LOC104730478 n=1 Tax=Camelina sativa TaxID=90675 RepID=A0ABM0UXY3_CAMSA|nr:PREDICTED: uncharacterized protein LOC104730478 [Camelina sativa]
MGEPNAKLLDLSRVPKVREGFYATNNQFQKEGPKGFIEVKVLENDKLYVRVHLPGLPDDAVRVRVDSVRQKVVFFSGETVINKMEGVREYSGTAGLGCDCCEITGVDDVKMKDGVLRMILSRVKVNKDAQHNNNNKCTLTVPPFTGQSGIRLEDHPYIVKGRKDALFFAPIGEGGCFFAVDLPGACGDDDVVEVSADEDTVGFKAEVKNVCENDESARTYLGSMKSPFGSSDQPLNTTHAIDWDVRFGVLMILVIPLGDIPTITNNNNDA